MTKEGTIIEKDKKIGQENESLELTNLLKEIMALKSELDSKLFSESELFDEELLLISIKIDKVINKYYKKKYKLYSEKLAIR